MTDPNTTPRYATLRDYHVDHLLGGPDSTRLEFDRACYETELFATTSGPYTLVEFLRENPESLAHSSVLASAYEGMDFFGHPEDEVRQSPIHKQYMQAGKKALAGYILTNRNKDFTVDSLVFEDSPLAPGAELREVARLSLQRFKVYEAAVETGEVPEL